MKDKLKQIFANNSDCYANPIYGEGGYGEGGGSPAMTESKFIEVVSGLFPTDAEIEAMAVKEYPPDGWSQYQRDTYIAAAHDIINKLK